MPTDRIALTVLQANNIGTTIRCAVAFGASRMLLVGQRRYSAHGAHGSDRHIQGRTQVLTLLPLLIIHLSGQNVHLRGYLIA